MEIVFILLVFIAIMLLVIWRPFLKQDKNQKNADRVASTQNGIREQTNIALYHEHKAEIEKDFSDGAIDDENYQYLLAELDNGLLQDIEVAKQSVILPNDEKAFSVIWPVMISLFIVGFSVSLYLKQGTLEQLMTNSTASPNNLQGQMSTEQQEQNRQKQILAYIEKMQTHLKSKPDDSEAWYNLGKTYVGAGEFDFAIAAFEQVMRIEGEHADILGAIAQASYYGNNQQIDEKTQGLIDKALALDINDPATNILLGMHNFIAQEYQQAIGNWQRIIDANRQGVNITALQEAVVEAKNRLGISANAFEGEQLVQPVATGPQLKVSVTLSADIVKKIAQGEDKTVFIYAIPTDGRRMPLAALKIMASDLPKVVTLNNGNAMSAQNNLSSVNSVHIYAIVSKLGGAGIKSGDFKAEVRNISVENTDTISLIIDSLVE
ncbi:MAG: c-type cytochrome biogenesis protein CcmI [Gammaproteobacteria bacterium]|nr:MAG: c-type cytochrome biogenesis protein CcmI [Gammaproteobacteria bacterium]